MRVVYSSRQAVVFVGSAPPPDIKASSFPLLYLCSPCEAVTQEQYSSLMNPPIEQADGRERLGGSLKMNTALEYSTRVVQEGGRRCKKSTLNDLVHLTPLRIPLMNPPVE
jgi:hypothetical protein